jgi:hypothetical protein
MVKRVTKKNKKGETPKKTIEKTREFSKFRKGSRHKVRKLVNYDENAHIFFTPDVILGKNKFKNITVVYEKSSADAINMLVKRGDESVKIIVTRIRLYDNDTQQAVPGAGGFHSIFFILKGDIIYLYDPNGNYSNKDRYIYKFNRNEPSTDMTEVQKYLRQKTKRLSKEVIVPTVQGIQQTHKTINNGYINDGGYCMFYNAFAIKHIDEALGKGRKLDRIYKDLYRNNRMSKIFSTDKEMGPRVEPLADRLASLV